MHTITRPLEERIARAVRETGVDQDLVQFVMINVSKIDILLKMHGDEVDERMVKNKILRDFFDALRPTYGDEFINRVQAYLKAVKATVKEDFPLEYFYRTSEVIEEARSLGCSVVIPHPEQFWPILLAEYDVDGYEVWNPQSQRYTKFLISTVKEKNKRQGFSKKEILVFMGDDTHMGEKVKETAHRDEAKAAREIGVQSAWKDLAIRKKIIKANMDKPRVISEYKARLDS
jgi:hypothetical protein